MAAEDESEHRAEPTPATAPGPGDLVIVPYPAARERYGCPAEAGLLLEDRRSVAKVFFAGLGGALWLERARLAAVPEGRLPIDPVVERLHRLARLTAAEEIEIYEWEPGEGEAHLHVRGLGLDVLLAARDLFGGDLVDLRLEAADMRRLRLAVRFRRPGTGTTRA